MLVVEGAVAKLQCVDFKTMFLNVWIRLETNRKDTVSDTIWLPARLPHANIEENRILGVQEESEKGMNPKFAFHSYMKFN